MKFSVGYQMMDEDEESFPAIVADYRDQIGEVFFPWMDLPSGRAALGSRRGYADWSAQPQLEADLKAIRDMGVRLDLLFNANCYGARAISDWLRHRVISILDHLHDIAGGADVVTTTSPFIAQIVREHAPKIEIRASVNMRIGTVQAMRYLGDRFDSYYVQRDYNRDLNRLNELKTWTAANDKRLVILANSGCLRFCPAQTFHDNLVAHEAEIDETRNYKNVGPHLCWSLFADPANRAYILQNTWIRPEDLHHYDGLVDTIKLATRMHARPRMVIQAYCERRFRGNLLDLFEPGFSPAFAPWILDNERFPADWFERTSGCGYTCDGCSYCAGVLRQTLQQAPGAPATFPMAV